MGAVRVALRFVLAGGLVVGGAAAVTERAAAASLPLSWQQAERLNLLCLVANGANLAERLALQSALCARVAARAGTGAPMPVAEIAFGDPAAIDPGSVTLLIHAAIESDSNGRRLLLTLRPHRSGGAERTILFGAAPRSVPIGPEGPAAAALDAAIDAALSEILPWRAGR
jgi:hypothetical protein